MAQQSGPFNFTVTERASDKKEEEDGGANDEVEESPDVYFKPVTRLLEHVKVKTHEEDEAVFYSERAKLFRFDVPSNEWKERGTGAVKLLQHNQNKKIRLVMRRDKTFKVCANHHISKTMTLVPNISSDRSWVWFTPADFSDGAPNPEKLAIRFINSEKAAAFKAKFQEAKDINTALENAESEGSKKDTTTQGENDYVEDEDTNSEDNDEEDEDVKTKDTASEDGLKSNTKNDSEDGLESNNKNANTPVDDESSEPGKSDKPINL